MTEPNYLRFDASVRPMGSQSLINYQSSMEEKRKHQRIDVDLQAYVSAGGSVMSCVVRNISVEGAAIEVENAAFVPPRFRLVMAGDSSVRECKVAWIQQNRIGLSFVDPQ
jgi:hypothetical protein